MTCDSTIQTGKTFATRPKSDGAEHAYLRLISGESRGPLAGAGRVVLRGAETPYRWMMRARNKLYDCQPSRVRSLGRPTISVGNITAGGTGKTPVVVWLAERLAAEGYRPAVLLRGYRKRGSIFSDEAEMLSELLPGVPVQADPDRVAGAQAVLARHGQTDCFILDDGFQHRRAGRSFDLVLIHAGEPFGFGHVHPRGLLREPLDGLARAGAILITHASEVGAETLLKTQQVIAKYTDAPVFHCDHVNSGIVSPDGGTSRELSDLAMMPFYLMAGIGQPRPLAESLMRFASYRGEKFFDDHHCYQAEELQDLNRSAQDAGAKALLTTEKDWAKLAPLYRGQSGLLPLYRLRLEIRIWESEQPILWKLISTAMFDRKAS